MDPTIDLGGDLELGSLDTSLYLIDAEGPPDLDAVNDGLAGGA